ncbi:MAG: histidinol-phosphate transaminase [Sulfuricaulis sp.]|uniref:histidinol-phosphate transaminase n=1 Tax=Sulfuricaulis sp. TaxID=2003553 RepID=UPI0025F93B3A|nr:histidinol-phosphate transaminase [Sulfuricaulis sp.]MCR4348051.1 histidinol-phosphate transaminase [Sulfuricaulis sp.]
MNNRILDLATPGVRELEPYKPGKPIEELEREYGVTGAIKLASNENPLGPNPRALAAARDALTGIHRYPDGSGFALKKALAKKHGVRPDGITLGNGSSDILEFLAHAFVLPENEVVFSEHAFALYPIVTRAVGAKAVITPAKNWGHDLAAMRQAVNSRTRLIFIANPNNPTGTWLKSDELEDFIRALPAHVLVAVDAAYFEYAGEREYPDTITWAAKYPNLVTTRTFSKAHGLAGLRVGYGISSPAVAEVLNRVRPPFNVNSVALAAAVAALEDGTHVERAVQNNRDGMRLLITAFTEMGLAHIPSAGNFICVDLKNPAKAVNEALMRQGVIVRSVAEYGMPNHLRITVGLPEENERFINALKKAISTQK